MRLLTVGSLPPEWGGPARGGVATFHAALLEGLSRRDDVEVVGVMPPGPLRRDIPVPTWVRPEEVGRAQFYERVLEEAEPDVVLMNHFATTIGVTHARLGNAPPAIGIAHSWHQILFRVGEERRRAEELTEEALVGLAALVCPSCHCYEQGERLGLPYPAAVRVVHYPLQSLFLGDGLDVEGEGSRSGVVYVGSLVARKNPAALVEAAALLPGLEVTLVGEGEEEDRLRELIERLGLGARVRIAKLPEDGHLDALRELLLGARLLCLPSESESFGIVYIEALACGTPVVGFGPTVREIGEAAGIEVGAALEGNSPQEVAAAIERVLAAGWDPRQLRQATLAAFGLEGTVDAYVELAAQA